MATPKRTTRRDSGPRALRRVAAITEGGFAGVARRLGRSRQTVSAWGRGRSTPTLANVRRMERLLGISARLWTEER